MKGYQCIGCKYANFNPLIQPCVDCRFFNYAPPSRYIQEDISNKYDCRGYMWEVEKNVTSNPHNCSFCSLVNGVPTEYRSRSHASEISCYQIDEYGGEDEDKVFITENPAFDPVENPSHYTNGRKYEPRKVIADWELNFNLGNAVKYISRAGRKGNKKEDLQKAIQYLKFELEDCEEE